MNLECSVPLVARCLIQGTAHQSEILVPGEAREAMQWDSQPLHICYYSAVSLGLLNANRCQSMLQVECPPPESCQVLEQWRPRPELNVAVNV